MASYPPAPAAEHVETARQLERLPRSEEALGRGEIGYQHAVAMARTAEHAGAAQVRKAESMLLKAAEKMTPGSSPAWPSGARANVAGSRPQLVITTAADTLAGIEGAPAGRLEWGGTVPAETVRPLACDAAITRITGLGEFEWEITHASRTIPPATWRALVARDHHCVLPGCDRPAP